MVRRFRRYHGNCQRRLLHILTFAQRNQRHSIKRRVFMAEEQRCPLAVAVAVRLVFWQLTVTPCVHAIASARVISTHSHSRRLIILLATRLSSLFVVFPRSAGSLPSNIAGRAPAHGPGHLLCLTLPPPNRTLHCTTLAQAAVRPIPVYRYQCFSSQGDRVHRVEQIWSFCARAPSPECF